MKAFLEDRLRTLNRLSTNEPNPITKRGIDLEIEQIRTSLNIDKTKQLLGINR